MSHDDERKLRSSIGRRYRPARVIRCGEIEPDHSATIRMPYRTLEQEATAWIAEMRAGRP